MAVCILFIYLFIQFVFKSIEVILHKFHKYSIGCSKCLSKAKLLTPDRDVDTILFPAAMESLMNIPLALKM